MSPKNPYHAYRKATHTVSKTRQVVMLYEGILRNLNQAREAIASKNIEERYNKLVRTSEIVVGLQMSLDFNQGEDAAQALYDFYSSLDKRIIKLQRTNDLTLCDEMIADVRSMYDVWNKIDRGESDDIEAQQAQPSATVPAQRQETPVGEQEKLDELALLEQAVDEAEENKSASDAGNVTISV